MKKDNNGKPAFLQVDHPPSLNFAIFIEDVFSIDDDLGKAEVAPKSASKLNSLVESVPWPSVVPAWRGWWNILLLGRSQVHLSSRERDRFFDPPEFTSLKEFPILKNCCQVTWNVFAEWWWAKRGGVHYLKQMLDSIDGQYILSKLRQISDCKPKSTFYVDINYGEKSDISKDKPNYILAGVNELSSDESLCLFLAKKFSQVR